MATCTATRKDGKPCTANAMRGKPVCVGHDAAMQKRSYVTHREAKANGARIGTPGKPPNAMELLRTRLEEEADAIVKELMRIALHAEKAVVVPGTKDEPGTINMVPDLDARARAIKELYDRGYGRAAQSLKVGGLAGGEPVRVNVPRNADRAQQVADILARQGAIPTPHEGRSRSAPPEQPIRDAGSKN